MSKIRFLNNKELMAIVVAVGIFVVLLFINGVILTSRILRVYGEKPKENLSESLDTKTVRQAVEEIMIDK